MPLSKRGQESQVNDQNFMYLDILMTREGCACRLRGGGHVAEIIDLCDAQTLGYEIGDINNSSDNGWQNIPLAVRAADTETRKWGEKGREGERTPSQGRGGEVGYGRGAYVRLRRASGWAFRLLIFLTLSSISSIPNDSAFRKSFPFRHNIMLVDNPLHQSSVPLGPTDLSDFVNMDLFTTQGSTSSNSREPSPSISTPLFSPLPIISEQNPSDWFNFSLEEDFVKADHSTPPPVTGGPWDFLTLSNDSPDSGSAGTGSRLSPSFAIDPQLMSSSVPPQTAHDLREVKEVAEIGREDEEEEEEMIASLPAKVGGKGKSRKGIVQSGGIQKKATISAVVRDKDDPRDDGDDWRPSPEEYKKMSSKEKRQLRNKISARNFRVRRKGEIISFCDHCN